MKSPHKHISATPKISAADKHIITTYAQLEQHLRAFGDGHLKRLFITGRPGTGKSRSVRATLGNRACYIPGKVTGFELYKQLWWNRNRPIVLDDNDGLLCDQQSVRLLKDLCDTTVPNEVHWRSRLLGDGDEEEYLGNEEEIGERGTEGSIPKQFETSSPVIIIANEWERLNINIGALEDRGHVLRFEPTAEEVHRCAGAWFEDREIYEWIGQQLDQIPEHSLRYYVRARELKQAGLDWQKWLLEEWHADPNVVVFLQLLENHSLTQGERAKLYAKRTGRSVRDYYNKSKRLHRQMKLKNVHSCSTDTPKAPAASAKLHTPAASGEQACWASPVEILAPTAPQPHKAAVRTAPVSPAAIVVDHHSASETDKKGKAESGGAPTTQDSVAAMLNAGRRITWPRGANAIKVALSNGKKSFVLKGNEDTLRGAGLDDATLVEFGHVPSNGKRQPQWKRFKVISHPTESSRRVPTRLHTKTTNP